MINLNEDVSAVTQIPVRILDRIDEKSIDLISHALKEALENGETSLAIEDGVGTIIINRIDDELKYKFIPSKQLERSLIKMIKGAPDPLEIQIGDSLRNKVISAYKELF